MNMKKYCTYTSLLLLFLIITGTTPVNAAKALPQNTRRQPIHLNLSTITTQEKSRKDLTTGNHNVAQTHHTEKAATQAYNNAMSERSTANLLAHAEIAWKKEQQEKARQTELESAKIPTKVDPNNKEDQVIMVPSGRRSASVRIIKSQSSSKPETTAKTETEIKSKETTETKAQEETMTQEKVTATEEIAVETLANVTEQIVEAILNNSKTETHIDHSSRQISEGLQEALKIPCSNLFTKETKYSEPIEENKLQALHQERDIALQHTTANPTLQKSFPETLPTNGLVRLKNEFSEFFDNQKGSRFDHQIHRELCGNVKEITNIVHSNLYNPYPEAIAPAVYQFSAIAEQERNPDIKSALTDFCHYATQAAQGAANLAKKAGMSVARIAKMATETAIERKKDFVLGMLRHPIETLHKEYIEPLTAAGQYLGKAIYLAATDPQRLARAGIRNIDSLITTASTNPEAFMAMGLSMLVDPNIKNFRKLLNGTGIVNALKQQEHLVKFAEKGRKVVEQAKNAITKPIGTMIEKSTEAISSRFEKILDKVKFYEQARNKALKIIGDLGANSKPHIGNLGIGNGKIVGRQSLDGKFRWRLDYDPKKGPHINIEDFRAGKGINATKIAIPFEGDLNSVESLLKHLNK